MFKKTSIRLELAIGLKALLGYNSLMLAGWFIKCNLSTATQQFTKKKEAKKKDSNSSSFINKIMHTNLKAGLTIRSISSSKSKLQFQPINYYQLLCLTSSTYFQSASVGG